MEEKITSMTEEEFSNAAHAVGWDDNSINETIKDARLSADEEYAKKHRIISIPEDKFLAMAYEMTFKHKPVYPEAIQSA
ncbi:MAG: hypothetical protein VZR56_12350 [Treponema sp.]|nr:hypothetical protein [Treponema sp.]